MNTQPSTLNPHPSIEPYPGHTEEARKRKERIAAIERGHAAVLPGALREAFAGEPAHVGEHQLQPVTLGLTANLERIKSPLLDVVRVMREELSKNDPAQPPTENPERVKDISPGSASGPLPASATLGKDPKTSAADSESARSANQQLRLSQIMETVKGRIAKEIQFQEEQIAETVFVFTRPQKRVRKLLDAGRDKFREAAMEELGDRLHPAQMAALQRACSQHYVQSFATIIGYGTPPPEEGAAVFPPPSPGAVTGSAGG